MALEHMKTWQIGAVKITRLVEVWKWEDDIWMVLEDSKPEICAGQPWPLPHHATPEGRMFINFQAFVIQVGKRRIMIDTCVGADREREFPVFTRMHTTFLQDLASIGITPGDIDTVLCTHLHFDHVGWNTRLVDGRWVPTFANARYVFGRTEYEHWRDHSDESDKAAVFNDSVKPVVDAGKADLVASDARICDEITLIPTPGHSPGHVSLHIKSDGEEGLLTGDVAHHPGQMAHLDWSSTADSDPAQSAETRRELFSRFADTPTLVIGGHFNAGRIQRDGSAFKYVVLGS